MVHPPNDPFNLARFVAAQEGTADHALGELRAGKKRSHWMWFIFPQIVGLGSSPMAQRYAVTSVDEARAYLAHPVLGARLLDCTVAALTAPGSAHDLFGSPDDMKFRSSMTLFAEAFPGEPSFTRALDRFYGGKPDPATLERISRTG